VKLHTLSFLSGGSRGWVQVVHTPSWRFFFIMYFLKISLNICCLCSSSPPAENGAPPWEQSWIYPCYYSKTVLSLSWKITLGEHQGPFNLSLVFKVVLHFVRGPNEYQLWMKTDLYTIKHTQWFFFRLRNTRAGVTYRFHILNFIKVLDIRSLLILSHIFVCS